MDRGGGAPDVDDVLVGLTRWLADQRADAAAASRAREHWLQQAADEEATFAGVLLDLAERAATITVAGAGGRTRRGTVRAVGEDFVLLRTEADDVLVRVASIVEVRADGPSPRGADRPPALAMDLADALAAIAGDRPRVVAVARDGRSVAGDLRGVGRDVATLRVAASATSFVPIASLAEVVVVGGAR